MLRRAALALLALLVCARSAAAQNGGFQLNRYEPTAAGEWSLLVDHPWYSSTRYVAAGLTLNYARNPLLSGSQDLFGNFSREGAIISDQLLLHVDLAASFLDRVLLTASLPVTLLERGAPKEGIAPLSGGAVGDLRLGALGRLYGQPYRSPFSLHLGVSVFFPFGSLTGAFPPQVGETGVRVLPRLIASGYTHRVLYSALVGFYYRPRQSIGELAPTALNGVGSSLQLGLALAYADPRRGFAIGPEVLFGTSVIGAPFRLYHSGLELLLGVHYRIGRFVQVSLGGGVGFLGEPGTPDGRVLVRSAFAPDRAGPAPAPDRDRDGVEDRLDLCPAEAAGPLPDPRRRGCPRPLLVSDVDGDGVPDAEDRCSNQPAGPRPAREPERRGCPDQDGDGDGVPDGEDRCRAEAAGPHPAREPERRGCPDRDGDGDGVLDGEDLCRGDAAGPRPDPDRRGCPAAPPRGAALRARAIAVIRRGLKDPARAVRLRAVEAAVGDVALLPEAQQRLEDPELTLPLVRLLGRRGDHSSAAALVALLARTTDLKVYVATAAALAQLGEAEGRARLREAQKAKNEEARVRAALALAALEDRPGLKPLRRFIGNGGGLSEELLLEGLSQLARAGDAAAAERLRGFLSANLVALEPRVLAARALLAIKDEAAQTELRQMMSKAGTARLLAARVLAEQGDAAACQLLTAAARREQEPMARLLIAEGLSGCAGSDVEPLAAMLESSDDQAELRVAAAAAVLALVPEGAAAVTPASAGTRGTKEPERGAAEGGARARALEVVRKGLGSGERAARLAALRAAAGLPELVREVLQQLEEPALQEAAARLLGDRGGEQARAPVRTLLDRTQDAMTFVAAAEALARLGDGLGRKRLSEALKVRDRAMQLRAALGLARLGDGKARKALKKLAAQPGPGGDVLYVEALGELARAGDKVANRRLLALASQPASEELRTVTAQALSLSKDAGGQAALRQMLKQGGAPRLAAGLALAVAGDDEACRALVGVLRDGQAGVALAAAAEGLGSCGAAADGAALVGLMEQGAATEELRVAAAGALLRLTPAAPAPAAEAPATSAMVPASPAPAAIPASLDPAARAHAVAVVREGLGSAARGVRITALRAAATEPVLLGDVRRLLTQADVQAEAARLLGEVRCKEAGADLDALLERTTDGAVFVVSAEALWRLGERKGQKRLQEAAKAREPTMRLQATLALAQGGSRKAQKQLRSALAGAQGVSAGLQLQAQAELLRQGDPAAQERLRAFAESAAGPEELRVLAARELVRAGGDEVRRQLRSRLQDPRERRKAALVLAELGDGDACRALAELLQDPREPERAAVAAGLGTCGPAAARVLSTRLQDPSLPEDLRVSIAAALLRSGR